MLAPQHDMSIEQLVVNPESMLGSTAILTGERVQVWVRHANYGQRNETEVERRVYIDGSLVNVTTVSFCEAGKSGWTYCEWVPVAAGRYNITACLSPVANETYLENNNMTIFAMVADVRIKSGAYAKYSYMYTGGLLPQNETIVWELLEFLNVTGRKATVRQTIHFVDETEQNSTFTIDVLYGSAIAIPPNSAIDDLIRVTAHPLSSTTVITNVAGEAVANYAGLDRTVVYSNFSLAGHQYAYVWDKETGILLESEASLTDYSVTSITTENTIIPEFPLQTLFALLMLATASATILARKRTKAPL
jgi:hypothetical protein